MRALVTNKVLRRAANDPKTGFKNNGSNESKNYIKRLVEMMNSKKRSKGGFGKEIYNNATRAKARNLLARYRKAQRGKGALNARSATNKLAEHQKKRRNNNSYRTNAFRRLEQKVTNGKNIDVRNLLNDALKAKEAGNLTNQEYVELQNATKNVTKAKRPNINITNNNNNNNNNKTKALVAKLSNNARVKREAATKRRTNMLQSIRNLKKITNSTQLNAAKNNLRSRVTAGTFATATKTRMMSAISRVKLNSTPAPAPAPAPAPEPPIPERLTANEKGKSPMVTPVSTNGNRAAIENMLTALKSSANQMSTADFSQKYKQISNSLKNSNFTDLKTSLRMIGMQRQTNKNNFMPNTFNNTGPIASRVRGRGG
jgi:hypothetical protein